MIGVLNREAADAQLIERYPTPYLTFLYTLRRRRAIEPELFYDYWRDTHCQISARLPGQHSLWIHLLDFERGGLWPHIAGIDRELAEADRFDGVPEPVFLSAADVEAFGVAMLPLEDDEPNIFEETIAYRALGANSFTVIDRLPDPAPDLDEGVLRFLVFCQSAAGIQPDDFRGFLRHELGPRWADSDEVLKLRMHLLEPYHNNDLLMDSGGVSHHKPADKQYQACFEIVFADALALRRFAAGAAFSAERQREFMRAQHPFLVSRRHCMRYHDKLTLTGLRTAAVAEQIHHVGALNQVNAAALALVAGSGLAGDVMPSVSLTKGIT